MSTRLPNLPPPALRIQGNDLYNGKQLLQYAMEALDARHAKQVTPAAHVDDVLVAVQHQLDVRDSWLGSGVPAPPAEEAGTLRMLRAAEIEIRRLRELIDTPQTADWFQSVALEAAHQQERWGSSHDAGKASEDWIFLVGHLCGKASAAFKAGDHDKGLHHIISSSATLRNWHRHVTGNDAGMRPGIVAPAEAPDDTPLETGEGDAR